MKIKYNRDINCNKCGSNNTAFVVNKSKKKFKNPIFLRCMNCGKERELTHTEGSSYAIWQMDTKNWKELLVKE